MKEDRFDSLLRRELKKETGHIGVSDFLKTRIDMEITARQEESTMKKRMHFKRYIAAAACICLLIPAGIFAGGKAVSSYVSSTGAADYAASTQWSDLDKMEKKVGIKTDAVKNFSNGYHYKDIDISSFNALDADGNKMFKVKELGVIYENAAGHELNCSMHAADDRMRDDQTADLTAEYDGITVEYFQNTYKFVPADYQETEEDKAMEAAGDYFISYGNDKVEVRESSSVQWEKDGISYMIQGFDIDISPQDMLSMAGEMIQG